MNESRPNPKILIVDDKPENLSALEKLLRKLEVEVIQATSGSEALGLTLEHDLCLAIVDVQMPKMDGYELVGLLRGNPKTASLPVIFVSAIYSDEYHHRKGYDTGAVDFLSKPFVPEILLSKIRVFLDLYHQRIALQELVNELHIKNEALENEIKQRRQAEIVLKRQAQELARSNAELEQFSYMVSHDLQEPLRMVSNYLELLKYRYSDQLNHDADDFIAFAVDGVTRMYALINDMLEYSRVTTRSQPFAPVDLAQVAREVISDLDVRIEQVGGRVNVGDLPTIDADPTQMRQLLQNLIGNALKFHRPDEPPVVEVHGQLLDPPVQRPAEAGPGEALCQITVQDNGIGFEEEYLDRIFRIFQRLHNRSEYEGSGVGLAICSKIVERHSGSITARSTPGRGATFIVTLPVEQPHVEYSR
jgi:signal transduction histidine kinase